MTNVVVTGAGGFIGRHVVEALGRHEGIRVSPIARDTSEPVLAEALRGADVVIHLAGANRPPVDTAFQAVNVDFTARVCGLLADGGHPVPVVFSSSSQATHAGAYGSSKRDAEEVLAAYAARSGSAVTIFRLTNVFGKWARPYYNSFVATLCHSVARGESYTVSDPAKLLRLVYVDDVVSALLGAALGSSARAGVIHTEAGPVHEIPLGDLVSRVESFRAHRETLLLADLADRFNVALYATYLSYLEPRDFSYLLPARHDARGSLAEFVKSSAMGQIFVSRTLPGVTRGNHYHHTKTEKFLVVQGDGLVRLRHIESDEVIEHRASGRDYRVVDIPPGYTHSIENVGAGEMVTVFWASEILDPARPDTYADPVLDVTT